MNTMNTLSKVRTTARPTTPEAGRCAELAELRKAHSESAITLPPGTKSATAARGPSLRIKLRRRPVVMDVSTTVHAITGFRVHHAETWACIGESTMEL
jgi:hypothetical protein